MKQFGPFPMTERGVPSSLYTHPKEPRVIYPSGRSVVVRGLDDPSDCFVYHGHNHPVTVAKFSPSGYWVASAGEHVLCLSRERREPSYYLLSAAQHESP